MSDFNYQVLLDLEKKVLAGEKLSYHENKMLIILQKYYYGSKG